MSLAKESIDAANECLKEMQIEIKTGMKATLKGYGDRIWRVEDICKMQGGETRYKVCNTEPTSGGMMGSGCAYTRRLVTRSELNVIVESIEKPPTP